MASGALVSTLVPVAKQGYQLAQQRWGKRPGLYLMGQAAGRITRRVQNRRRRRGKKVRFPQLPGLMMGGTVGAPVNTSTSQVSNQKKTETYSGVEQLAAVSASSTVNKFLCIEYNMNVTNKEFFPRMAQMAVQYQCFKVKSLTWSFVPIQNTQTAGTIYMSWTSDPQQGPPTTSVEMTEMSGSKTGSPWLPLSMTISGDMFNRAVNENYCKIDYQSIQNPMNSCGQFFFGSEGLAVASQKLGTLKLSFVIELRKPRLTPTGASLSGHLKLANGATGVITGADIGSWTGFCPWNLLAGTNRCWATGYYPLIGMNPHYIVSTLTGAVNRAITLEGMSQSDVAGAEITGSHAWSDATRSMQALSLC